MDCSQVMSDVSLYFSAVRFFSDQLFFHTASGGWRSGLGEGSGLEARVRMVVAKAMGKQILFFQRRRKIADRLEIKQGECRKSIARLFSLSFSPPWAIRRVCAAVRWKFGEAGRHWSSNSLGRGEMSWQLEPSWQRQIHALFCSLHRPSSSSLVQLAQFMLEKEVDTETA